MNMIERQLEVKMHCLDNLKTNQMHYPGYPETRFFREDFDDSLTVPFSKKWDTEQSLPTIDETTSLRTRMCRIDSLGRPVHPWFEELARSVGVVAGRGKYWSWGPNHTVDPIVITREKIPRILLIERSDNGASALPGGFLDHPSESTNEASKRECVEETGLELLSEPEKTIYRGVVSDSRTTAHAWAYTSAKLWRVDAAEPVYGQDDARAANWHPVDNLPKNLHGSHAKIIELALKEI